MTEYMNFIYKGQEYISENTRTTNVHMYKENARKFKEELQYFFVIELS